MREVLKIPKLSEKEKAFLWASIIVRNEDEKEQNDKLKSARKGRRR